MIPLNYSKFIVTSNFSIEQIYGPESKMSEEEASAAKVTVEAIKARFKVVYIADRTDSDYWKEHIHTIREGQQRVMKLQPPEEEKKEVKPSIPTIDKKKHVPAEIVDLNSVQSKLNIGVKRSREMSTEAATPTKRQKVDN